MPHNLKSQKEKLEWDDIIECLSNLRMVTFTQFITLSWMTKHGSINLILKQN